MILKTAQKQVSIDCPLIQSCSTLFSYLLSFSPNHSVPLPSPLPFTSLCPSYSYSTTANVYSEFAATVQNCSVSDSETTEEPSVSGSGDEPTEPIETNTSDPTDPQSTDGATDPTRPSGASTQRVNQLFLLFALFALLCAFF